LPVLLLQLPDALMLCGQRLASATLALLFSFKLADPAPEGTFATQNASLNMPVSYQLRDFWKYPTNIIPFSVPARVRLGTIGA
jgi:hypothetical protein